MTYQELIAALDSMGDPTLEAYQKKIVSDTGYPMRCIRVPEIRKLARKAAAGDWRELVAQARFQTYEEVLTIGLAIAYAPVPFEEKREPLRQILPRLDSWAMTDTICPR